MVQKKIDSVSSQLFKVRFLRRSREIYRKFAASKPWIGELYTSFLGLKTGQRIIDVGCGTGDFSRYLASLIHGSCNIVGVDLRDASLKVAEKETRKAGLDDKISFKKGDAYEVPLDDNHADLTCCRTLLMHLDDPTRAIREMTRVTKRGGSIAAIERGRTSSFFDPDDEDFTETVNRINSIYAKGVRKLEGKDFTIGDRLPSYLLSAGLNDIKAEVLADAWITCDSRRKVIDVKDELRFQLETLAETRGPERKVLRAGGAKNREINEYFKNHEIRLKRLLSDERKLRNNATFSVASWYLVTGTKK